LGCPIRRLPAAPELPDAVFVEDACVVLDELAVIARPGAQSRRAETESIAEALRPQRDLRFIVPPAALDGGDVLCLGRRVFVGVSNRTNHAAASQLQAFLGPLGHSVLPVQVTGRLHLKTAVSRVAENAVLVNRSWVDPGVFGDVEIIDVCPSEPFAANALLVRDTAVHPAAHTETRKRLEERGIRVAAIDISELSKAEAGVTCCSVIFHVG